MAYWNLEKEKIEEALDKQLKNGTNVTNQRKNNFPIM